MKSNIYTMLNEADINLDTYKKENFNDMEKKNIKNNFRKSINKKKSYKRNIAAAAALAVVLLGVTFNKPVMAAIKTTFWGNHAGIQRAAQNGYQQVVQGTSVKSNGVETKVTNIFADKSRIGFDINMKFEDINSIKDVIGIDPELVITDGNGKVISGATSTEGMTDVVNKDKGELKYNVLLESPSASIAQPSELKVQIKSVSLYKDEATLLKKIEGPWNNSVTLDKKFAKSSEVAYTAKNSSKDITVISAKMLSTGFAVKFVANIPVGENIIKMARLVDSKGNSYSSSGSGTMESKAENNNNLVSMIFEVSSFEKIDSFKLIVRDLNGKDSEVTLVKVNK